LRVDDPREGFPYDRVKAAQRYLFAVKPWWGRFAGHLTLVPTYTPPAPGQQWGSIPSTDAEMRLYVDRTFALTAPLHYIAGALENVYRHHTHGTWDRLRSLDPDDWRAYANIAFNLEINSAIDAEQRTLTLDRVYHGIQKSPVFSQGDFNRWQVTAPPGLDDEGWSPRVMELPEGLAAEEYVRVLKSSAQQYEDQEDALSDEGEDADDEADSRGQADAQDSSGDQQGLNNEGADGAGSDQDERDDFDIVRDTGEGAEDEDAASETGSESASGDETGDQEGDSNTGEGSEQPGDEGSGDEGQSADGDSSPGEGQQGEGSEGEGQDSSSEGDAESQGEGDGSGADSDSGATGTGSEGVPGEGSESAPGGDPSNMQEGQPGGADGTPVEGAGRPLASAEVGERMEQLMDEGHNDLWAAQIDNPDDPLSEPAWKPDEVNNEAPISPTERAEAYAQLEEDVRVAVDRGAMEPGSSGTAQLVKWAAEYRKARGMNWDSKLDRIFTAGFTSARAKGQSDLSYSVRNPNQQPLGPILPGLHSYAPEVGILQDVSASMRSNGRMANAMSVFTDVMGAILGKWGTKTMWVAADTIIRDVGTDSSWSDLLQERWSYGFGGTDFSDVMDLMMTGRVAWNGRKYPKLDLIVVATDCEFVWPEVRPRTRARIIVVNVGTEASAERYLPDWINRATEYVRVE